MKSKDIDLYNQGIAKATEEILKIIYDVDRCVTNLQITIINKSKELKK